MQIALWIVIGLLVLVFIKCVIMGPSIWDRLLGMGVIFSKVIVVIILFSSVRDTAYMLDFAIIYALFGFLGTIFIALFLSERSKKGRQ